MQTLKTSPISKNEIIGQWVFEYIKQYVLEKPAIPGQKVILKIEHMPIEYTAAIINFIENRKAEVTNQFEILLKTTQTVEGFDSLKLKDHETIVWLRNNIKENQVVVLLINEEKPEGQSLKDIVSVDETTLLSTKGLNTLDRYLEERELLQLEEIKQLMRFISCYQQVTDMQLSTLLEYLAAVINSASININERLANAYPALQLFKENEIDLRNKDRFLRELRKNFYLGSLRKSMTQLLNIEKLMESAEKFLHNEREIQYASPLWKKYQYDVALFKQDVEDFLYRKNKNLLQIEYAEAEKLFNFKETRKLKDRLMQVYESVQENYNKKIKDVTDANERSKLANEKMQSETEILEGIASVENKSDLETIREFREKYEVHLEEAGVLRNIKSIESKLESPSEYGDLIRAILSEALILTEGLDNTQFEKTIRFKLSLSEPGLAEKAAQAINFHLNLLNNSNKFIDITLASIDDSLNDIPEQIKFQLDIIEVDDVESTTIHESTTFLLDCSGLEKNNTSFFEFLNMIQNEEPIGYVEAYENKHEMKSFNEDLKIVKVISKVEAPCLEKHILLFEQFMKDYQSLLKELVDAHYSEDIFKRLEKLILDLLKNSYEDIAAVDKIYSLFNKIAATQVMTKHQSVQSYTLSVFHPMRLIGYMSKFERLEKIFEEILDRSYLTNRVSEVADLKKYIEYLLAKLGEVPPAYLTRSSTDAIYILESECFGEGVYTLDAAHSSTTEKAELFANEVQKVTTDYLKVYPFAKDSLNLLFMYVTDESFVIKAIDHILKNSHVQKLNIAVYSREQSSQIFHRLSQWIQTREEYIVPLLHLGGLPKVEISIIPHNREESTRDLIKNTLSDYDLAFFMDFLTQASSSTIKKDFFDSEIVQCDLTDHQWSIFDEVGYINKQGGSRHINFVAPELPELLADYYELQYMVNKKFARNKSQNVQLLKAEITLAENAQNKLYEEMHELFNWVVAYDRYIDPLIAKQLTSKAEIIKYSVVQRAKNDVKILISSSESVNRLINQKDDYHYQDRIANRLKDLLGVKAIKSEVTRDMIRKTKSLSGGSVLRSLGAGKFMHELLSIYLTLTQTEAHSEDNKINVWALCDELEWFRTKSKRPDLLQTIIEPDIENRKFIVTLRLIELKLIHRQSYEQESKDALVQLDAGMATLNKYFDGIEFKLDKDNRAEAFYKHLMNSRAYSTDELIFMRQLRKGTDWEIEYRFEKQADIYMYSHDDQFVDKTKVEPGHYTDSYEEGQIRNTYTRSHILNLLQIEADSAEIELLELDSFEFDQHLFSVAETFGIEIDVAQDEVDNTTNIESDFGETDMDVEKEDDSEVVTEIPSTQMNYPEVEALQHMQYSHTPLKERMQQGEALATNYQLKLQNGFRQNGITISIKEKVVGANIIRLIGTIPVTEKFNSIKSKENEMAMWLQVSEPPRVMNAGNIVIDVNRKEPDVIYFQEFMEFVRTQIPNEDIQKKAVVPIGLSPLNEVMYMDLNDTIAHILVAGTTGSGKSVSLNSMVLSMMCLYNSNQLKFVFIDPKQVEFSIYEDAAHTEKVITDQEQTADYLERMTELMDERYEKMRNKKVKNISGYNRKCMKNGKPEKCLHRIIIVFDEFADFMLLDSDIAKRIEKSIQRLGQKSRAAGIHLIISTQSPKADVINTNIRNNLNGRVCLLVSDSNASSVVIDEPGAELLAGKGDYLMRGNNNRLERGMSPFLDEETLDELLEYFKK